MSNETDVQRALMQSLFDAYGDDEIAVCDAYAEAERAGKVQRRTGASSPRAMRVASGRTAKPKAGWGRPLPTERSRPLFVALSPMDGRSTWAKAY